MLGVQSVSLQALTVLSLSWKFFHMNLQLKTGVRASRDTKMMQLYCSGRGWHKDREQNVLWNIRLKTEE